MHLHLWSSDLRKKGLGLAFLHQCILYYFEYFKLKTLICEPYALIQAPNATLPQLGFIKQKHIETLQEPLTFNKK